MLGWHALNLEIIRQLAAANESLKTRYRPTLLAAQFDGAPVLDIRTGAGGERVWLASLFRPALDAAGPLSDEQLAVVFRRIDGLTGTLVLAALVFSMTFAVALATESSRNGFEVVFSLLIVYYVARMFFVGGRGRLFWFFSLQQSPDTYAMGAYDWFLTQQQVHYFAPLLMIAATAVLPFLAQLSFERKDL